MTQLIQGLPFLIGGLISVTIIDTAGAIASRRLGFNYGYLTFASLIVYTLIGSFVSKKLGLDIAILISLIISFYEGTVGYMLSKKLNANTGLTDEELQKLTVSFNLPVIYSLY